MRRWQPYELIGAALLLFTPLTIRVLAGQPLIPAPDSYTYLYTSSPEPYALLLKLLAPLGDARIMLSLLLGLVSVLLFRRVAERFTTHDTLAVTLFILNPLFLAVFTSTTPLVIALPLFLFAVDSTLKGDRRLAFAALLLLSLSSPLLGLATSILLLFRDRRPALPAAFAAVALLVAWWALNLWRPGIALPIAEFGEPFGLSLLFSLLGLIEAVFRWNEGEQRKLIGLFLALLLLAPFGLLPLTALLSIPFAASFLGRLWKRRWAIKDAQPVVLLLIGCTLLFLTLTNAAVVARQAPSNELVTLLAALPPDDGIVLAPVRLAPIVAATGHPVVLAETGCREERCRRIERLFASQRVTDTDKELVAENITYVLLTQEQRRKEWNRDDEGLLFVLPNSQRFTLIAEDEDEQLWRYAR